MAKHLGIDFSWILMDLGGQVGAKLVSKIDHKSIKKLDVFQSRFCPPLSLRFPSAFGLLRPGFCAQLGAPMAPTWLPKRRQIPLKNDQKNDQNVDAS